MAVVLVFHDFGSLNVIQVFGERGVLLFVFLEKSGRLFASSETFVIPSQEATVEEARRPKDVFICNANEAT